MGSDKQLLIMMVPHTSLISLTLDIFHSYPIQAHQTSVRGEKGNENRKFRAINDKNRRFYQKIRRLEVEELDLNRFFPIITMKQLSLYINHSRCHLFALVQRLVDPHLVENGKER